MSVVCEENKVNLKNERLAKNIAQFEELERTYENGHRSYGMTFKLRGAAHEEEFFATMKDFYGDRLDWTPYLRGFYPQTVSVTIQSRDFITAINTPLGEDESV